MYDCWEKAMYVYWNYSTEEGSVSERWQHLCLKEAKKFAVLMSYLFKKNANTRLRYWSGFAKSRNRHSDSDIYFAMIWKVNSPAPVYSFRYKWNLFSIFVVIITGKKLLVSSLLIELKTSLCRMYFLHTHFDQTSFLTLPELKRAPLGPRI